MKKTKNKILSGILALTMVVGMLPMTSTTAHAADTVASSLPMVMDMSGIQNVNTNDVAGSDQIVMGTYNGSPVYWVMIGDSPVNTGESYITNGTGKMMFAVQSLRQSDFEFDGNSYYPSSTLNTVMTNLFNDSLTSTEKSAVLATTLAKSSMYRAASVNDLTNQHFFPLSESEYFNRVKHESKLSQDTSVSLWWLRSSIDGGTATAVDSLLGGGSWHPVNITGGVRPAFNLNLSSVLFTSAAVGGKSSFGGVAGPILGEISGATPTRWKLTLEDTSRSAFAIGTTAISGNAYTVAYSGATTGTNEYISAIVVNDTGEITHYGKVKALLNSSDASGTFTVDIAIPSGSTLKIFNEQANGDEKTDYSSQLLDMSTTVNAFSVTNTLTNISSSNLNTIHTLTSDYTATLTANAGYVLPQAITVSVGSTNLTSGYTYTQSSGSLTIPQANITGDIEITATALAINNLASVTVSDVAYGTAINPTVAYSGGASATNGGAVVLEYKEQGEADSTYTTTEPQYVGDYTVRATSAATPTVAAGTQTGNFSITTADQTPTITAATSVQGGNSIDLSTLVANAEGDVSFTKVSGDGTLTGTTYTAPNTTGTAVFTVDITGKDLGGSSENEYNSYTQVNAITVNITAVPTVAPTPNTGNTSPAKYNLVVNYGSGDGSFEAGTWITITAENRTGYTFSHWASNEVTFENAKAGTTRFIMNDKNVEVTAVYTLNGGTIVTAPAETVKPEETAKPEDSTEETAPVETVKPAETEEPVVEETLENEETLAEGENSMLPIIGIGVVVISIAGFVILRKRKSE